MDSLTQVMSQNVSTASQALVLKKAEQLDGQSALSLIDGADESAQQMQQYNPPYLGQNLDVRA